MKENKSNEQTSEESKTGNTNSAKEVVKSKNVFQKYPFVFILLGALIISIFWGVLKVNSLEKTHADSIEQLNLDHKAQLDSIALINASQVISSLTWAVRSEMTRENMEQVNTYFIQLIKEPSIERIQLVEHSTGNVLLSTNKKDEGTVLKNEFILSVKAPISKLQDKGIISAAPVYGLSEQLGILVIERTR